MIWPDHSKASSLLPLEALVGIFYLIFKDLLDGLKEEINIVVRL